MKQTAIAFVIMALLSSCSQNEPKITQTNVDGTRFAVMELDGCEYIICKNAMAHKGNCKYCEQRRKQAVAEK